jgi:hypothetical protein
VSYPVLVGLAGLIHLDWHLGRPHQMRLSLEWGHHCLAAIPGFALAGWECLIGLGLLSGKLLRATLALLFVQMLGTLAPLVLFPHEVFVRIPFMPTLEGQYIIKNLVLISAGVVVGATVRGGHLDAEPD